MGEPPEPGRGGPELIRSRLADGTYLTKEMAERVAERLIESGDLGL